MLSGFLFARQCLIQFRQPLRCADVYPAACMAFAEEVAGGDRGVEQWAEFHGAVGGDVAEHRWRIDADAGVGDGFAALGGDDVFAIEAEVAAGVVGGVADEKQAGATFGAFLPEFCGRP